MLQPSFRQNSPFCPNLWKLESTVCLSSGEKSFNQRSFAFLPLHTKHCRFSYSPNLLFSFMERPRDLVKGLWALPLQLSLVCYFQRKSDFAALLLRCLCRDCCTVPTGLLGHLSHMHCCDQLLLFPFSLHNCKQFCAFCMLLKCMPVYNLKC